MSDPPAGSIGGPLPGIGEMASFRALHALQEQTTLSTLQGGGEGEGGLSATPLLSFFACGRRFVNGVLYGWGTTDGGWGSIFKTVVDYLHISWMLRDMSR